MPRRRAAIWGPRRLGCLTGTFNLAPTMSNNSVFTKKNWKSCPPTRLAVTGERRRNIRNAKSEGGLLLWPGGDGFNSLVAAGHLVRSEVKADERLVGLPPSNLFGLLSTVKARARAHAGGRTHGNMARLRSRRDRNKSLIVDFNASMCRGW